MDISFYPSKLKSNKQNGQNLLPQILISALSNSILHIGHFIFILQIIYNYLAFYLLNFLINLSISEKHWVSSHILNGVRIFFTIIIPFLFQLKIRFYIYFYNYRNGLNLLQLQHHKYYNCFF
jgi:hypothetical protein